MKPASEEIHVNLEELEALLERKRATLETHPESPPRQLPASVSAGRTSELKGTEKNRKNLDIYRIYDMT
jgi:hypothetical protein